MTGGLLRKRIDTGVLPALLCVVAFLRPEYLVEIGVLGWPYFYFRVCVMSILILAVLLGRKWDAFFGLWVLFWLWMCLTTLLNHAAIQQAVEQAAIVVSLAALFCLYRGKLRLLLKVTWLYLCVLVVINLVTMIAFPAGLYSLSTTNLNWFLGFKNWHLPYHLLAVALTLLFWRLEGFSVWKCAILVAIGIAAILGQSATQLVALALTLILGVVPWVSRRVSVFNAYTYLVATVAAFYGVVVLRMQQVFAFMIVDLLGKSLDLSNRTTLWDIVMIEVAKSPFIGHGEQTSEFMHLLFLDSSIVSAHNQILHYLYTGGAVGLLLYACINLMIASRLFTYRKSAIAQVAAAVWFALLIALLSEVYMQAAAYMVYFVAFYAVDMDFSGLHSERSDGRWEAATPRRRVVSGA